MFEEILAYLKLSSLYIQTEVVNGRMAKCLNNAVNRKALHLNTASSLAYSSHGLPGVVHALVQLCDIKLDKMRPTGAIQ